MIAKTDPRVNGKKEKTIQGREEKRGWVKVRHLGREQIVP